MQAWGLAAQWALPEEDVPGFLLLHFVAAEVQYVLAVLLMGVLPVACGFCCDGLSHAESLS